MNCHHCNDPCSNDLIREGDKIFCCNGCRMVYRILSGQKKDFGNVHPPGHRFAYLDDPQFQDRFINYRAGSIARVTLNLPAIHCSACIYVLENLPRMEAGIQSVRVDFFKKESTIVYDESRTSLRALVELLYSIGYEPNLNYSLNRPEPHKIERRLYIKLGVAGFCFGNVMLFALPDYFSGGRLDPMFETVFRYLNLLLSFPVLYAASDYFLSALSGLRERYINMDVPVAIGVLALFTRSAFDILSGESPGYVDSLSGLVFFLLIGRIFQNKTYSALSFERDYRSYFPLSVLRIDRNRSDKKESFVSLDEIRVGDRLLLRNGEIVPADSIVMSPRAVVDFSFVTGESRPVVLGNGERVFAGGKITGTVTEVEVIKTVSQSYLTQLWNQQSTNRHTNVRISELSGTAARYFTYTILTIAIGAGLFWMQSDMAQGLNVMTAVLIIACPCALALTIPFTFGTLMRRFGREGFYLKSSEYIEVMNKIDTVIFDKTGTLTKPQSDHIAFIGPLLNEEDLLLIKSLVYQSSHPLSRLIYDHIQSNGYLKQLSAEEISSRGLKGECDGTEIKIGQYDWVTSSSVNPFSSPDDRDVEGSKVHVSINGQYKGYFRLQTAYRDGIGVLADSLKKKYKLLVISGDHEKERERLAGIMGGDVRMHFRQMPHDKSLYAQELRRQGSRVMMIGDGLNDSGALRESDFGVAVTDQAGTFTPGSDAIMNADALTRLPDFMSLSSQAIRTVYLGFGMSFIYNTIGIGLAVTGLISPLVSAILMPISSVSVVALSVGVMRWHIQKALKK